MRAPALATLLSLLTPHPIAQDIAPETSQPAPSTARDLAPVAPGHVGTLVHSLPAGTGGLEVDAQGFVYSADFGSRLGGGGTGGDKVFRIDPNTGQASVFIEGLAGASGNAIGPDGAFYQSSIGGQFITRHVDGQPASVFLNQGLRAPVGIAIDEEGVLFVANCGSNRVIEVHPNGDRDVFCADALLAGPNGIAISEEHELYVANFSNGDVIRIDWSGEASRLATLPGNNNGHLVHREGFLYVAARGAHQIYRVSLEGEVELFAGSGKRGHDDGPRLEASFSYPNDLAFSPDGRWLYVNENQPLEGPHTVLAPTVLRRIRLSGQD